MMLLIKSSRGSPPDPLRLPLLEERVMRVRSNCRLTAYRLHSRLTTHYSQVPRGTGLPATSLSSIRHMVVIGGKQIVGSHRNRAAQDSKCPSADPAASSPHRCYDAAGRRARYAAMTNRVLKFGGLLVVAYGVLLFLKASDARMGNGEAPTTIARPVVSDECASQQKGPPKPMLVAVPVRSQHQ